MATFTVTTLNDSGAGSLRQAILDANANADPANTITFAVTGTITLTSGGLPIITKDLEILGPGPSSLTISGNNAFRVFQIAVGINVTIQGVSIVNGSAFNGAAIGNDGTLTVRNSIISQNSAVFGGGLVNTPLGTLTVISSSILGNSATVSGGGIDNSGTLIVHSSTFSGNSAIFGGSIQNFGTLTVNGTTFSGNSATVTGGAIDNSGMATVSSSTLSGNTADFGGGIENFNALTVSDTTISGNTAGTNGGGIDNSGTATVINSKLLGNIADFGGGIENFNTLTVSDTTLSGNTAGTNGGGIDNSGTLMVINSTLSGNSAQAGGGIENFSAMTIINSTISGNSAGTSGGGIDNGGTANISFTTIAFTTAGSGIAVFGGTVNVKNSIVANNVGGNCSGAGTTNFGGNFSTDSSCPGFREASIAALALGPLALNPPGRTATHALFPGSVAINGAVDCSDIAGNPVTTDQRGVPRPQGLLCDSGAYEAQLFALVRKPPLFISDGSCQSQRISRPFQIRGR